MCKPIARLYLAILPIGMGFVPKLSHYWPVISQAAGCLLAHDHDLSRNEIARWLRAGPVLRWTFDTTPRPLEGYRVPLPDDPSIENDLVDATLVQRAPPGR